MAIITCLSFVKRQLFSTAALTNIMINNLDISDILHIFAYAF